MDQWSQIRINMIISRIRIRIRIKVMRLRIPEYRYVLPPRYREKEAQLIFLQISRGLVKLEVFYSAKFSQVINSVLDPKPVPWFLTRQKRGYKQISICYKDLRE